MKTFTKPKFLSLDTEERHRVLVKKLRALYEELSPSLLDEYNELTMWLSLSPLKLSPKAISDRYHEHLALGNLSRKEHNLLPFISKTDREEPISAPHAAHIYLDNIRSAHNVGSILRTTEAFALGEVYFSSSTPYIDQKQVQDAAMGADKWLTCHQNTNLNDLPRPLIALETSPSALPLKSVQFPKNFTLAIGNEEYGCSDEILKQADILIEIPMWGRKNSLNVANAFAIVAAAIRN